MSIDERKEKEERCKIMFESELIYIYDMKSYNIMHHIHDNKLNNID